MYCKPKVEMLGNSTRKLIKILQERQRFHTEIFEKLNVITLCKRCFQRYSIKEINHRRLSIRKSAFTAMAESQSGEQKGLKRQSFDYFLVLDFEATCQKEGVIKPQV